MRSRFRELFTRYGFLLTLLCLLVSSAIWTGYTSTLFWVDPKEELIAILMVQHPARLGRYIVLHRNLAYKAIID